MSTHELPQTIAKSSWRHVGKIGALAAITAISIVPAAKAVVVDTNSLAIASGGTLDLTGHGAPLAVTHNSVIVRSPSDPTQLSNVNNIRGWINTGYNGGLWTGTGITSGTAADDALVNGVLGVMLYDNDQLRYTSWEGKDLTTNPHQVMIRMTYAGDYDGDGLATVADYGFLDFYFGSSLHAQGDIDGDGMATPADYGLLDFTFSQNTYGPLGNSVPSLGGFAPAPEPSTTMLLGFGVVCALNVRRRKSALNS